MSGNIYLSILHVKVVCASCFHIIFENSLMSNVFHWFSILLTRQVISCLSISLVENKYLGYACVALSVELSNMLLHLRQLLKIAQVPKDNVWYLVNRWVNLFAFVFLRGSVLLFLNSKMMQHHDSVPGAVLFVASLCLVVVSTMTIVLFFRLLWSEFGPNNRENADKVTQNKKPDNNRLINSALKVLLTNCSRNERISGWIHSK